MSWNPFSSQKGGSNFFTKYALYPGPSHQYSLGDLKEIQEYDDFELMLVPDGHQGQIPCLFFDYQVIKERERVELEAIQSPKRYVRKKINPADCLPFPEEEKRVILYFHGNSEDTISSIGLLTNLSKSLKASVLAVEYPGYGIFSQRIYNGRPTGDKLTCQTEIIKENALRAYQYLKDSGYADDQIYVYGRSIGTGPACYVASQFNPQALILISAFTTISDVAGSKSFGLLKQVFSDHYNNIDAMRTATCPVLLIHGKKDSVIPCDHSKQLKDTLDSLGKHAHLITHSHMTHNDFRLHEDILDKAKEFAKQIDPRPSL